LDATPAHIVTLLTLMIMWVATRRFAPRIAR